MWAEPPRQRPFKVHLPADIHFQLILNCVLLIAKCLSLTVNLQSNDIHCEHTKQWHPRWNSKQCLPSPFLTLMFCNTTWRQLRFSRMNANSLIKYCYTQTNKKNKKIKSGTLYIWWNLIISTDGGIIGKHVHPPFQKRPTFTAPSCVGGAAQLRSGWGPKENEPNVFSVEKKNPTPFSFWHRLCCVDSRTKKRNWQFCV